MEGVNYNYRLSKEHNVVDFLLPIQFYTEAYLDSISVSVNILSRAEVVFLISKDKTNFYNNYLSGRNSIIIPKETIDMLCTYGTICRIKFEIQSKEEAEIYLEFKVSVTRKNPEYVPRNTMIMDRIADSYRRIFYTYISNADLERIKFSFNNMGLDPSFKIVECNSNKTRNDLVNNLWYSYSYFSDEFISLNNTQCINGCWLLFYIINPVTEGRAKYLFFFENNNHYINSLQNERIKSRFNKLNKLYYTFQFTLKGISKFQIVLGGAEVQYQFINENKTVPCCESFTKIHYPEEGSSFIDNVIGDGSKTYDITFNIRATTTKQNSLVSYFDITVLPFEYSNVPLYYINDGESVNCYTGKNNNSSYIVLKKDFGIVYYSVEFNGIEPKEFALYYQCYDYIKESEKIIHIMENICKS